MEKGGGLGGGIRKCWRKGEGSGEGGVLDEY